MKIELIGGPVDGLKVEWPDNENTAQIKYYGGHATYTLEQPKTEGLKAMTAIYKEG